MGWLRKVYLKRYNLKEENKVVLVEGISKGFGLGSI